MPDEIEELKAELHRIEQERKDTLNNFITWAVVIAVALLLIWAYHRGSTGVNAPGPNDPTCQATNDEGITYCN